MIDVFSKGKTDLVTVYAERIYVEDTRDIGQDLLDLYERRVIVETTDGERVVLLCQAVKKESLKLRRTRRSPWNWLY